MAGRSDAAGGAGWELTPLKECVWASATCPLGFLLGCWRTAAGARADGHAQRGVVRRLLLGADGLVVRARGNEPDLDGVDRRIIAAEKVLPQRRAATIGTAALLGALGCCACVAPESSRLSIPSG